MPLQVSVGQYRATGSVIHRLDPRVKVVSCLIYMVSCPFISGPAPFSLAASALALVLAAAHIPVGRVLAQARPLAAFLILTALLNLMLSDEGPIIFTLGPLAVHSGGIDAALLYTGRFCLLLFAGGLLMFTTSPVELCDAFERLLAPAAHLGAPVRQAALTLSIALSFVPTLASEAGRIISAQRSRAARFDTGPLAARLRRYLALVVPLFASALRHADALGTALDARCYGNACPRTRYREARLSPRRDGAACALTALYLVAFALLSLSTR